MIRLTFRHDETTESVVVTGQTVRIQHESLVVDGRTIAYKWPTAKGPWLLQGRPHSAWMHLEIESIP